MKRDLQPVAVRLGTPPSRHVPPSLSLPGGSLDAVLRPASVAVIGASRDPAKRGHHIVRSLLESGFGGRVVPVNPGGGELLGLAVAPSIGDVSPPPELAVICTPAATVPAVLDTCAAAGVGAAVILAVGFGESGASGARLEAEVAAIARRNGIRVVGPNTSGLVNVPLGLNLIGVRGVRAGRLALLVQSGNLALQLMTECAARSSAGFSFIIGAGNEIDIRFHEYLHALADDESTGVILMHAEGFRDGRAFYETARDVSARKPIVLLKGARSASGGEAARSHTGAVAGEYAVLHAALRQAGVIEVTRTDELLHVGEALAGQPPIGPGADVAVLSDGGGHAALAVDALVALGTPLAVLGEDTRERLRVLLGDAAAAGNPVDIAGAADGNPTIFVDALSALAADPGVGAILVVGLFGGYAIRFSESLLPLELDAAAAMTRVAREAGVALVMHSLYAGKRSAPLRAVAAAGVPVIESLEVACRCAAALAERGRIIARLREHSSSRGLGSFEESVAVEGPLTLTLSPARWGEGSRSRDARSRAAGVLSETSVLEPEGVRCESSLIELEGGLGGSSRLAPQRVHGESSLLEPEARALAAAFGVPFAPATFCETADEAVQAAAGFGGPVAMKVVAPAALHKTDAGGVLLGVDVADAGVAFERIVDSVRHYARSKGEDSVVRGVLVSPMMPVPVAELLIGVRRDAQFGPVLAIGSGGTLVELLDDVALRAVPASDREVREAIEELRVGRILRGVRGGPAADVEGVVRLAQSLAGCALAHAALDAIELNPVFVYSDRAVALDARAVSAAR